MWWGEIAVIDRREQQRVVPGGDGRFADRLDDPTVDVEREVGTVVFGRTDGGRSSRRPRRPRRFRAT